MEQAPGSNQQFPNINIPDSKKDEAWHKQAVEAITNRSLNQTYTLNYVMMNESVNYFQSLQSGDEYKFLQESADGEALPAKWMNLNRIRPKLSIVMGEFWEKGYDINVKAINTEAVSRKLAEKERIRVEMRMQPAAMAMEQQTGLQFQSSEQLPQDEEELDYHMSSSYKETSEFVMESALKWLSKKFDWEYTRMQLFADVIMMGRCFSKIEIVNGYPRIRRIDPRLMIFDTNATDDFLSDSTFFGEVRYMGMAEVIEQYSLSAEEIEEIKTSAKQMNNGNSFTNLASQDFITAQDNRVLYYKQEAGELRLLVVTGCWADTKPHNKKINKDSFGTEHIQPAGPGDKGENVKKARVKIWRKGTILGGKVLKDWGELENQPRDIDNPAETQAPYQCCIPFFLNGVGVSTVQLLKPLQDLKDITAYNIQLAMSRAGAKGFMYDLAQLPEGIDIEQAIKYARTAGLGLIDSQRNGLSAQFNQFQTYDMTISDSVSRYIEIMAMIDSEMDAISGINEARQGMVQGSSQAVGVTQSALFQSNLSTAPLFKLFRMFTTHCFGQQAKLVKIAWAGKEKFAAIIGDVGVDFLAQDIELDLNDYGVFVDEVPPMLDDLNSFREFVMAGLQSQTIDFIDALELMQEKDIKIATRKYRRAVEKKEQKMMEYEQKMQEQQAQADAEAQQAVMEAQAQAEERKAQVGMQVEQLKGANKLKDTFTKGKIELAGKKIDLLK